VKNSESGRYRSQNNEENGSSFCSDLQLRGTRLQREFVSKAPDEFEAFNFCSLATSVDVYVISELALIIHAWTLVVRYVVGARYMFATHKEIQIG